MKELFRQLMGSLGYEIHRKSESNGSSEPIYFAEFDRDADEQIRIIRSHTMLPYARLYSLYQQAVYCETAGVSGSFVECGNWKGGAVGLMALANLAYGAERRQLHLFDSFEGIPEPDETVDGAKAIAQALQAGGGAKGQMKPLPNLYESAGTLEINRELLEETIGYPSGALHYHQGWFQDTLPREAHETGEIAILRLDGDWYASTKICLENLYHQVARGGFVIIDDYGCYEGCRKAVDEFMQREGIQTFLHRIDNEGIYWIK